MELTVGDAILLLSKYQKNLRIMVDAYEGGFDDPDIHFHNVVEAKNKLDYTGIYHDYPTKGMATVGEPIQALVLRRRRMTFEDTSEPPFKFVTKQDLVIHAKMLSGAYTVFKLAAKEMMEGGELPVDVTLAMTEVSAGLEKLQKYVKVI